MAQLVKADLDQMVFEGREKNYGAYFLRKKYPRHLMIGTLLIGSFALIGTFGPLMARAYGWIKDKPVVEMPMISLTMENIDPPPPIDKDTPPPTPPPRLDPPKLAVIDSRIPEPVPIEDADENQEVKTIEEIREAPNLGLKDVEGENIAALFDPGEGEVEVPEVLVDPTPAPGDFVVVEEEPQPVNIGDIKKLIGYPTIARDAGIEGKVILRILVDKKGKYTKHLVINQSHPVLTAAVEKHISKLKFTPAVQGGRPIKFWVNIPFNFELLNN